MEIILLNDAARFLRMRPHQLKAAMEALGYSVYRWSARRRFLYWQDFVAAFEAQAEAPAAKALVTRISAEQRRAASPRACRPSRPGSA